MTDYFKAFAPRLHNYYETTIDELIKWSPRTIKRMYEGSAFAAMTFNIGPRTITFPHRDWANLSWGWCAICALGEFDSNEGGHLVLWDLKLAIRFPSGSTIIIPSAMVRHSNTSVGKNDTRYSVTQYSAGGLFRWVENGFKADGKWSKKAKKYEKEVQRKEGKTRWEKGLTMLSNLSEL
jgi:hypothetical protein